MQALSLLTSFAGWYVSVRESRRVRQEYDKILTIVRNSGLLRPLDNDPNPSWEQWVYEEKRRRFYSCILASNPQGHVVFLHARLRFRHVLW